MIHISSPVNDLAWKPSLVCISWKERKTDKRATPKRGKRRAKAITLPAKKKTTLSFYSSAYPLNKRTTRKPTSVKDLTVQPLFKRLVQLPIVGLISVKDMEIQNEPN